MLTGAGVWKGGDLASRTEWQGRFEEANPLQIREELESSRALMLSGFPVAQYDRDGARTAFMDWCSRLGTLLSQNERGKRRLMWRMRDLRIATLVCVALIRTKTLVSYGLLRCHLLFCAGERAEGGENELVSSMHLFNEIGKRRPDLLEILMQPFVYKRHKVDLGNELPYCEQSHFSFRDGFFARSFFRHADRSRSR